MPKQLVDVHFNGIGQVFNNVEYIELEGNGLPFFKLELKGDKYYLFHAKDYLFDTILPGDTKTLPLSYTPYGNVKLPTLHTAEGAPRFVRTYSEVTSFTGEFYSIAAESPSSNVFVHCRKIIKGADHRNVSSIQILRTL